MLEVLAEAATWPDAFVRICLIALLGFIFWCIFR